MLDSYRADAGYKWNGAESIFNDWCQYLSSFQALTFLSTPFLLVKTVSLPESDQIGWTFEDWVSLDVVVGGELQADWGPRVLRAEELRDLVEEAAALCDGGGAVVCLEPGDSGGRGLHFQHLRSNCRGIHR